MSLTMSNIQLIIDKYSSHESSVHIMNLDDIVISNTHFYYLFIVMKTIKNY